LIFDVRLDTSLELLLERAPLLTDTPVLATIVGTSGSTYRKPGARMLMMADGNFLGLLSGGCLESDLQAHAREVRDNGAPQAIEYDMRGPDDVLFGIGAGCEGAMRILLEPAGDGTTAAAALSMAGTASQRGDASALLLIHDSTQFRLGTYAMGSDLPQPFAKAASEALAAKHSRAVVVGSGNTRTRAFIQYIAPAPHLLICGAGPDAQPVVSVARSLGWRVTVVDHRPHFAQSGRFAGARVLCARADQLRSTVDLSRCHAAVVMSHHLTSDESYLRELSVAGLPPYVGLLGPESRRQRLMSALGAVGDGLTARIHGPVGIAIGAATPEAIALSIVAQIHAWLAGREPMAMAWQRDTEKVTWARGG
jgi:xanthine/CO dehydrogenase XdhC/CoxF family maturation factor